MDIIDDRHGEISTITTSQLPVIISLDSFAGPTISYAILDRFINGTNRIELRGESMRKILQIMF